MDLDEFEKRAETIFKEYFDHGDPQEVATSLEEFNIRNIKHEVNSNTWYGVFKALLVIDQSISLSLFSLKTDRSCADHCGSGGESCQP